MCFWICPWAWMFRNLRCLGVHLQSYNYCPSYAVPWDIRSGPRDTCLNYILFDLLQCTRCDAPVVQCLETSTGPKCSSMDCWCTISRLLLTHPIALYLSTRVYLNHYLDRSHSWQSPHRGLSSENRTHDHTIGKDNCSPSSYEALLLSLLFGDWWD